MEYEGADGIRIAEIHAHDDAGILGHVIVEKGHADRIAQKILVHLVAVLFTQLKMQLMDVKRVHLE